jgi:hypothetical protein
MAERSDERRHYFRIDDKAYLRVKLLSEEAYQQMMKRGGPEHDGSGLAAQLHTLTVQLGNVLLTIRKNNPEVAQYLQLLDKKLEIVARQVEGGRGETITPDTRVNLCNGGIAYWNETLVARDTKLEIHLVLFPSYLRIAALGRVAHCEEDPQAPAPRRFRIGVEFTRIGEAEEDGLARHLIELQSAQLRRQRGR